MIFKVNWVGFPREPLARLSISPSLPQTLISVDSSRWSQMAVTICQPLHHAACRTAAMPWCLDENTYSNFHPVGHNVAVAVVCYKLRGPAWAVGSYGISSLAGGISQILIFKTLRQTGWKRCTSFNDLLFWILGQEMNTESDKKYCPRMQKICLKLLWIGYLWADWVAGHSMPKNLKNGQAFLTNAVETFLIMTGIARTPCSKCT